MPVMDRDSTRLGPGLSGSEDVVRTSRTCTCSTANRRSGDIGAFHRRNAIQAEGKSSVSVPDLSVSGFTVSPLFESPGTLLLSSLLLSVEPRSYNL